MLRITTYTSTLLIIVNLTLLYPNTLMSEPWKKSKNQAEITYLPLLPQNQLVNTCYLNVLPRVHAGQPTAIDAYPLQENSGVFGSSIADLSSTPLVQHYIDAGNAKPIKQGLNFLKLTKSKVDFEINTVETGLTLYPANTHYMPSSNSTIIIPKSDVYRPCQLLLNKKA